MAQHRPRNLINPFDQFPTSAFDGFVNDLSASIKKALHPEVPLIPPHIRKPRTSMSYYDTPRRHGFPPIYHDGVTPPTTTSSSRSSALPYQRNSAGQHNSSNGGSSKPGLNGSANANPPPSQNTHREVVDLTFDSSDDDGRNPTEEADDAQQERVSSLSDALYVSSDNEQEVESEANSDASFVGDVSGEEDPEENGPDDTFSLHASSAPQNLSKGKGRAADEGPGVQGLQGISERLQSVPFQSSLVQMERGSDDEEEREGSAPWASEEEQYGEQPYTDDDDVRSQQENYGEAYSEVDDEEHERPLHDSDDDELVNTSGDDDDLPANDAEANAGDWNQGLQEYDRSQSPPEYINVGDIEEVIEDDESNPVLSSDEEPVAKNEADEPTVGSLPSTSIPEVADGAPHAVTLESTDFVQQRLTSVFSGHYVAQDSELNPQVLVNIQSRTSPPPPEIEVAQSQDDLSALGTDGDIAFSVPATNFGDIEMSESGAKELFEHMMNSHVFENHDVPPASFPHMFTDQPSTTFDIPTSITYADGLSLSYPPSEQVAHEPTGNINSSADASVQYATYPADVGTTGVEALSESTFAPSERADGVVSSDFGVLPSYEDALAEQSTPVSQEHPSSTATEALVGVVDANYESTAGDATGSHDIVEGANDLPDPLAPPPPTNLGIPAISADIKRLSDKASPSVQAEAPATPMESLADTAVRSTAVLVNGDDVASDDNDNHMSSTLPDPRLPPSPTDLATPNIPPRMLHLDSDITPSLIVRAPASPSAENLDVQNPLEFPADSSARSSPALPDPYDAPSPTNLIAPDVHEVFAGEGATPSISVTPNPPTSPPPAQSTSARLTRMASPALDAARRLPLSARIGALRRSVSGSSSAAGDPEPRFVSPTSPASTSQPKATLSEAAVHEADKASSELESLDNERSTSMEVEPPTPQVPDAPASKPAIPMQEHDVFSLHVSPRSASMQPEDVPTHDAHVHGLDHDDIPSENVPSDAMDTEPYSDNAITDHPSPATENTPAVEGINVLPVLPHIGHGVDQEQDLQLTSSDAHKEAGAIPNDDPLAIPSARSSDGEIPWLNMADVPALMDAPDASASEVGELLEGTSTPTSSASQSDTATLRRSTRKRKRTESTAANGAVSQTSSPLPSPASRRPGPSKPGRFPRLSRTSPRKRNGVDDSDSRSVASSSLASQTSSRASSARRKSRLAPVVLIPSIHHFHNHNHAAQRPVRPETSESNRGSAAPSPSTGGLVTRSQCRFHKISAPGLIPDTSVFFIVPGCSLSATEVMKEESIEDCGIASEEDNLNKITEVDSLDATLASVLRKLVGPDLMHEGVCGYLPAPSVKEGELSQPLQVEDASRDGDIASDVSDAEEQNGTTPQPSPSRKSVGQSSARKRRPRHSSPHHDLADYVPTDTSETERDESNRPGPGKESGIDLTSTSLDPTGFVLESESQSIASPPSPTVSRRNGAGNRGRKRARDSDAMAYKPGGDGEESTEDEATRRKRTRRRPRDSSSLTKDTESDLSVSPSVAVPADSPAVPEAASTSTSISESLGSVGNSKKGWSSSFKFWKK